jgi:hypothetical protein
MTEQNNNLIKGQDKRELWPGRYYVENEGEAWPDGDIIPERCPVTGNIFRKVLWRYYQIKIPEEKVKALLEPLGFTPAMEEYKLLVFQAEETFSEEQANELITYLERYDTDAQKTPANKPRIVDLGLGMFPIAGFEVIYRISDAVGGPDYHNIGFRAWAQYASETLEHIVSTPEEELRRVLLKSQVEGRDYLKS